MKVHVYLLLLLFAPGILFSQTLTLNQAPLIWLRADMPGSDPLQWQDCRGNGFFAVSSLANTALPTDTFFNSNKAFYFDGSQAPLHLNFLPGADEFLNIYTVYQAADSSYELGIWHMQLDSVNDIQLTSRSIKSIDLDIEYSTVTYIDPIINSSIQQWKTHPVDSTLATMTLAGTDSLNFKGKFAEMMIFRNMKNLQDKIKVHTYLAMKYGVSLMDLNYHYSDTSVIWNYQQNKSYEYEIAGIGRDDSLGIDQKQSAGNGGLSELMISAGEAQICNDSNHFALSNYQALVWGHNGKDLLIDMDTNTTELYPHLLERKWLMQVKDARQLPSHIRFNTQKLGPVSDVKLVLNPRCLPAFYTDSTLTILPDSSDAQGNYYFYNVQWDADSSGQDLFTFSALPSSSAYASGKECDCVNECECESVSEEETHFSCKILPNPSKGNILIRYHADGESDVRLRLSTASGQLVYQEDLGLRQYFTHSLNLSTPGVYLLTVENNTKTQSYKIIVN